MRIVLLLSLPGICESISQAVIRSRAERESGKEWKTLRGRASRPESGERNLPVAGGHSALSVRWQRSTPLCKLSQEELGITLLHLHAVGKMITDVFIHCLLGNQATKMLYKIILFYLYCRIEIMLQSILNQRTRQYMVVCPVNICNVYLNC